MSTNEPTRQGDFALLGERIETALPAGEPLAEVRSYPVGCSARLGEAWVTRLAALIAVILTACACGATSPAARAQEQPLTPAICGARGQVLDLEGECVTLVPEATATLPGHPIDNVLDADLTNCDRHAQEQVARDDANWTIGPHLPRQFDSLWKQHVSEIEQQRRHCRQSAEAAAAQRVQQARNDALDQERGYQQITVETFELDGKDLAAASARVSVSGSLMSDGGVSVLFANRQAAILATKYSNVAGQHYATVPLLLDDASRSFRQNLLSCQSQPASSYFGCPVTVLGHATICTLSNEFGAARQLPCVAVEDGR